MEKSGGGGRRKAIKMWNQVKKLEGTDKVECIHCGHKFAARTDLIKHHIYQVKLKGVKICSNPPKNLDLEKGTIEKTAGAGGRPKDDVWEHVTVLKENQVRCKHCGFEFAGGAKRIRYHILQIKGQGIRPCPNSGKIIRDLKGKGHLLASQGSPVLDSKPHETMVGRYTREETKAVPQAHTRTKDMHQQKIKVGPFSVSNMVVNESDLRLIKYVFEQSCEEVFTSRRLQLLQRDLFTLKPGQYLDAWVIDVFADILAHKQRKKERKRNKSFDWYLPSIFSTQAFTQSEASFLHFVEASIRDNYLFGDVKRCGKIFIPVHVKKGEVGHFYLYVINVGEELVDIFDSLSNQFVNDSECHENTQKLLHLMDELFPKSDMRFKNFNAKRRANILLQPNGYDCGLFVINYMQQVPHFVKRNRDFQFDSDKERLDVVFKLLKSDLNEEKEKLHDQATRHYAQVGAEKDLSIRGTKRKRIDTSEPKSEDARRECAKGYILPTTDLGGKEVQRHIQQIWEWIMNNEASTIGIWGMGGTGKTALATLVNNKLLEEAGDDFDHIIWVTMSQSDNRVYQLQKAIARSINLDISDECDLKRISGKLLQASRHIKRCLLILDNVWDPIFLEEVGFPLSNDGIKLILTTRSWEVCQNMNCMKKTINIKPLDEEDSWDLFEKTLGIHQIQSSRVEPIARAMAKQCEGLPLAIITIARSIRGKEDYLREWNHMLEGMLEDMDERIFSALKSSYACLNNKLQRLFLYYALTAKENVRGSDVELLIRRFFSMGWTDETDSLEMQYDECYTMLHKLKNSSLLMEKNGRWRMHTLFRAMAINITKETEEIMVKPSRNLVQLPENGGWKENLQKVFLTESNVQKILDGTSPKCSRLSTLLLDCNYDLKWIPDDFLSNMVALEILDLSWTGIKRLPESLSNLDCLVALLLSGCTELSYVPSLAKLQRLIELDLSLTAITEAPGGLELLVNLKCLNLADTEQLKMSSSAISKMINLLSQVDELDPRFNECECTRSAGFEKVESYVSQLW